MKRTKRKLRWWHVAALAVLLLAVCGASLWCHTAPYRSKLWLHRCNSLEKLHEQEARFRNVEVDVVVRPDGMLDVTHDADTTFHLDLEPYFSELSRRGARLWMDVKNLDARTAPLLHTRLQQLCARYGVSRSQLILESRNLSQLATFTARGYYTSYYVSFAKPSQLSPADIDRCLQQLRTIARSRLVCALSFPGWWYGEIHRHLHEPIDLLTWKHRTTEAELRLWPANLPLLKNPQVKVILIKSKGRFHR